MVQKSQNQYNAGSFKLQYLTMKLKYEVELWDVERSMKATNISCLLQVGVVRYVWTCPK